MTAGGEERAPNPWRMVRLAYRMGAKEPLKEKNRKSSSRLHSQGGVAFGGGQNASEVKRLRAPQPRGCCALFQLCRKVFYASRLNLYVSLDLVIWLGKRFLNNWLWKAVNDCAKEQHSEKPARRHNFGARRIVFASRPSQSSTGIRHWRVGRRS